MYNIGLINTRTRWFLPILTLCIIMSSKILVAQTEKPKHAFETITTEEGLSNNFIFSICQDSFGFVWLGTTNGLCRYDSEETFTVYNENNSELKSSNIRSLLADSKNRLWIGTRLGGLSCHNLETGEWKTYVNDPADPSSISNNEILSIFEDSHGRIWVGTELGLNLFLQETENFKSWKPTKDQPKSLKNKAVLDIHEDSKGLIWFGLWDGGLNLILNSNSKNTDDFEFRNFQLSSNIASGNVWKILTAKDERLWIGTHGGGLFILDLPTNATSDSENQKWDITKTHVTLANNPTLESNTIDDILQDQDGNFWFATTNGMHFLNGESLKYNSSKKLKAESIEFHNYKISDDSEATIISNVINTITQSKDGLIWAGTISGLTIFQTKKSQIEFYKLPSITEANYLNNNFTVIDNSIWFVSGNNKLGRYTIANRKLEEIPIPALDSYTKLYTLYQTGDSELLICSNKSVIYYNILTKEINEYKAPPSILEKSNSLLGRSIVEDENDMVYISTEFGLITLEKKKNKFLFHRSSSEDDTSLTDNSITKIIKDSEGNIWVATYNGLNKLIDKKGDKLIFRRYLNSLDENRYTLKSNQILTLKELDKILYLGTTNGISTLDIRTDSNPKNKMPNIDNYIISLEKDINDNLWYSSTEGINCYNTKTNTISNYNLKDGLYDLGFRLMTSYSSKDGYVYFASQHGIARINSKIDDLKMNAPPVFITQAKTINNKNQELKNVLNLDHLELDAKNYYLELSFVGLSYDRIEKTSYAYKLEGLDDDWFYSDKVTTAVYTNLKPGDYTFKAKAANYQGIWNEEGAEITIVKKPSLIETKWFQAILTFLSLLLIWFVISIYTKNIKRNNQRLKDFNTSLNDEIEERMKVEKDLLQTNKDLQQFAYSASHDLQEPLRNIGNAVGLLKRKNDFDDKSNEYVEIAVEGVKRMSSLIQNLLNYAKTGSTNINLEKTDLNDLLKTKLKDLRSLIEEKNAHVLIKELPIIACEKNQLGVVFYNLINNALKFNNKEKPEIEIGISENGPPDKWQFYVKDNGLGIAPEYQNRIFTMFTRLENKREYEGTGIGLTLCQKIITRHNGTIWVSSTPNQGSTFFFTIDKNLSQ